MVYLKVRSSFISQKNEVDCDGGDATIIVIAWIRFSSLEKLFSFFSLVVISGSD